VKDKALLADAEKMGLLVTPMTGDEVEAYIGKIYKAPPDIVAAAKAISGE
jgi:hypothetical protein